VLHFGTGEVANGDIQLLQKENDLQYLTQLREGRNTDGKREWIVRPFLISLYHILSIRLHSTSSKQKASMTIQHSMKQ
jgi:hypothetical protein